MTELEKFDTNGNGKIDPEELQLIELEDRRRRMEDEDAKRDTQRAGRSPCLSIFRSDL